MGLGRIPDPVAPNTAFGRQGRRSDELKEWVLAHHCKQSKPQGTALPCPMQLTFLLPRQIK